MITLLKTRSKKCRGAFTLIEIMVAAAIMTVLVGLVLQITGEVLKAWNRSSGKLSANAEARIAMDLITQDLETAILRDNGQQWLLINGADGVGPYDNSTGGQTVSIKMFSPALDRDQSSAGDICAVAYELDFGPAYAGSEDNVYALYRKLVPPDVTFADLMGSPSDTSSPQLTLTGGEWDDVVDADKENYLVGNIVEFRVILYEDDGTGEAFPVNWDEASYTLTSGDFAYGGTATNTITDPLLYADVLLTVVTNEGLKLLQLFYDNVGGTGYDTVEDIIKEHGEVLTRRVNFMSSPL